MEFRAATRADLEQVLAIRGTSFNISGEDLPRPDQIPDADLQCHRVLAVDGRIVSCLTIYPTHVFVGASRVAMGGIGNVATLPSERNKGHASP